MSRAQSGFLGRHPEAPDVSAGARPPGLSAARDQWPDKPRPSLGSVSVCGTGRAARLADFAGLPSSHAGRQSSERGVRMSLPPAVRGWAGRWLGPNASHCFRDFVMDEMQMAPKLPTQRQDQVPSRSLSEYGQEAKNMASAILTGWCRLRPHVQMHAQKPIRPLTPQRCPQQGPRSQASRVPAERRHPSPLPIASPLPIVWSGLCLCQDTAGTGWGRCPHQRGGWQTECKARVPACPQRATASVPRPPHTRLAHGCRPRTWMRLAAPRAPPQVRFSDKAPVETLSFLAQVSLGLYKSDFSSLPGPTARNLSGVFPGSGREAFQALPVPSCHLWGLPVTCLQGCQSAR